MRKALKISGIVLASLIGLALIAAIVAATMLTSSGRLTQMVRKRVPQFVNCEVRLGQADLTLFKTFPSIGVEIDDVALINPMAGSLSDTLAQIDKLIVVADARKFMKEKEIVVRKCILEDAFVNLYVDSLGQNNMQVFKSRTDNDTTKASFDYLVDIEEVRLRNTTLRYTDDRNPMAVQATGLDLDLKGKMQDKDIRANLDIKKGDIDLQNKAMQLALHGLRLGFDGEIGQWDQINGTLTLATPDANLDWGESYLQHDTLNLNLPVQFSISERLGSLDEAKIGLNRYLIHLDGDAGMEENGDFGLDLKVRTGTLVIEDVLTYLPEKVQNRLKAVAFSGKMNITDAQVVGTVNDSLLPSITAKVNTDGATVSVADLPHPFTEVNLDAFLALDLNEKAGHVEVNSLKTKFNRSELSVKGRVDDLLGDLGFRLNVKGNVPLTDLKGFLPKNMKLAGHTDLNMDTDFTLNQLLKSLKDYDLNRLKAKADLKINDFTFDMDTIHASAPKLNVGMTLPASAKAKGHKGAYVTLASERLKAQAGKTIVADMKHPDIRFSADKLKGGLEKMDLDAALNFSQLELVYDSVTAQAGTPALTFVTMPEKTPKGLNARLTFNGNNVAATMGKGYALNSNSLKMNASVKQDKNKTDFLNRWNPTADFMLGNAVVQVDGIDENINISNIDFLFNSHELDFKKSTFRIGGSDLSLQGSVIGIKEWVEDHKNLMKGELQLTSNMLDFNEIMELTNGLGRSDEEKEADKGDDTEANPFMVPEGIDFNFVLNTHKSLYNNFDLNNLSGTLTVKDGTLILQEIGFTNKAAEMQLTAMYQSPRKNNLFLALDFHLLNVQINDLLFMIPYIDTLVPMLKTFDGQGEFHIGAETNLKANYEPKVSTLRAAADFEGRNLTVNDRFSFTKITDMLKISTNGEYRVDSLDVQLTAFKDEIDLWPSQIAIGKYKVTVDGRMNLDQTGEYHLSVTQSPLPVRLGLKISGPLNKLEYKLEDCKYPNLYKPNKRNDTEQMYFELKKKIADRLKENVR